MVPYPTNITWDFSFTVVRGARGRLHPRFSSPPWPRGVVRISGPAEKRARDFFLFYPIAAFLPKDLHALAAAAKVPIRMVPSQQAKNTSYLFRAIVFLV